MSAPECTCPPGAEPGLYPCPVHTREEDEIEMDEAGLYACEACGNDHCTSPDCAKQIRAELRAEEDHDDPGARAERRAARFAGLENE